MVQTRSTSGVDVPATPSGRPRSSGNAAPSTRKATGSVRSRKSSRGPNGRSSRRSSSVSSTFASASWVYVPDTLTLIWLAISLPLVLWDTGYVLGRPLTMPGGSLHWPIWSPYALYGEVDHMYGFKQWNAQNGFTAAQGTLNLIETALYFAYLYVWQTQGQSTGVEGARKGLVGRAAAWAVVLILSSSIMTLSKTVLYCGFSLFVFVSSMYVNTTNRPGLNEYYSGFDNIAQNDIYALIFLWIIPNGAWLVFPTYMIYKIGGETIDALASTADHVKEE